MEGAERGNGGNMTDSDTISLLKECNSGIKMGISSLDDVMEHVHASDLKKVLQKAKREHEKLGDETHDILLKYHEEGKEPHPMAKMMSVMKTSTKIAMDESDRTIAELLTDGCDMGIKSLHKYLNRYKSAHEEVRSLTGRIIDSEENLRRDIQGYL